MIFIQLDRFMLSKYVIDCLRNIEVVCFLTITLIMTERTVLQIQQDSTETNLEATYLVES